MFFSPGAAESASPSRSPAIALAAILVLAALLRFTGIGWGLPSAEAPLPFHPDEKWILDALAQMNPSTGDFNPNGAHIEGTLNYYLWATGSRIVLAATPSASASDPAGHDRLVLLTARVMNVVFDLATIALLFFTGRALTGRFSGGLAAALLLTVMPGEVIFSRYARTHVLANTWLALTMFLSVKFARGELRARGMIFFGAVLGWTAATRYTSALSAIFFAVPWIASGWAARMDARQAGSPSPLWKNLGLAVATSLVAFLVVDPWPLLDPESIRADLRRLAPFANTGEFSGSRLLYPRAFLEYLGFLIPHAATWPMAGAMYAACLYQIVRLRDQKDRAFRLSALLFLGGYLFFVAKGYSQPIYVRATLPLLPVGCLLLAEMWTRLTATLSAPGRNTAHVFALLLLVGAPARYSLGYSLMMCGEDPRMEARQWVLRNVPPENPVGVSNTPHFYSVPLGDRPTLLLRGLGNPEHFTPDVEGLASSPLQVWITTDFEMLESNVASIESATRFRLVPDFLRREAPLGVNLKRGKTLPHDYDYPCPDVFLFRRDGP